MEEEGEGHKTSITNVSVPLLSAILAAIWLVGTSITLTIQWTAVKSSLVELSLQIKTVGDNLKDRIGIVERDMATKDFSRWTRENQELWCVRTEQKNDGWKCCDIPTPQPNFPKAGSLEWWTDGVAPKPEIKRGG